MDPFSMLLMGGLGVGGNLLGNLMANTFNVQNIEQQEAFQANMANTAFQRARADMEKAGINPIMAYGHPASAPSGAAAQMSAPGLGDSAVSGVKAAMDIGTQLKQQDLLTEQAGSTHMDSVIKAKNANILDADVAEAAARRGVLGTGAGMEAFKTGQIARYENMTGMEGLIAGVLTRLGFSAKDAATAAVSKGKLPGMGQPPSGPDVGAIDPMGVQTGGGFYQAQ